MVTTATTFTYTWSAAPGHPTASGFGFAGRSFELIASNPISGAIDIGLNYRDQDLLDANIEDEATLRLYYWNTGLSAWDDVVNTCSGLDYIRYPAINALRAPVCHLSEFGLFGEAEQYVIYLPLVLRNH